jgi:hypothetical protein
MTPLRGSKVWQMALLELWLQRHVDDAATAAPVWSDSVPKVVGQ